MAEQDFIISIRTTADTAGIAQTEGELRKLGVQVESIRPAAEAAGQGVTIVGNAFGLLVGRLAAGFGVGALFNNIQQVTEEIKKITAELDKQGGQLVENAQKYADEAKNATTEGDVLKIASSALRDVELAHKGIISAQQEELSLYQKITDAIYHAAVQGAAIGDPGAGKISEKALQLRKDAADQMARLADQEARGAIRTAQAFTEAFEQRKEQPIDEAVADLNAQIDKAREKQQGLNEESGSYVKDWVDAQREIEKTIRLIDLLIQAEKRRKQEAGETAEEHEKDVDFWQKQVKGASPQVQAILKQQQAAATARTEGREKDAAMFEKSGEAFKRGATEKQRAELEPFLAKAEGVAGRRAETGESQTLVDQMERNRINFERQLEGGKPMEEKGGGGLNADVVEALNRLADLWK